MGRLLVVLRALQNDIFCVVSCDVIFAESGSEQRFPTEFSVFIIAKGYNHMPSGTKNPNDVGNLARTSWAIFNSLLRAKKRGGGFAPPPVFYFLSSS